MNNSKYLFIFAVVTLVFATVFAFLKISDTVFFDIKPPKPKKIKPADVGVDNKLWLTELEKNSTKGNFLADEFHLNWDLVSPEFTKERVFIITYDSMDKYKYSCLTQILDEFKVKSNVKKLGDDYSVKIEVKDQKVASGLMEKLDKYDINGKYKIIYQFKDSLKDGSK